MFGCALALATCKWHIYIYAYIYIYIYIVSEEGFILTGDGWLRAHARSCIWCITTAKKVKENNLLEQEYSFLKKKNHCALLQMKHLAEWKSHERNHALKVKLVILYSRYMKKVLVTGKGYSGALMRARVRARASGKPCWVEIKWKEPLKEQTFNPLGKWKRIPLTGKG